MVTTARCIGLLDRTGAVQSAVGFLDPDVDLVEFSRATDLDDTAELLDVLVVGLKETTPAGLRRIARFLAEQPAVVVVAHVAPAYDKQAFAAAGIHHVVKGAATSRKLATAVGRADDALRQLALAAEHLRVEEPTALELAVDDDLEELGDLEEVEDAGVLDEPAADAAGEPFEAGDDAVLPARRAKLVTVASATGGCGKTFYATNLAGVLARRGARVLVVDLDLQFGEVAAALHVRHPFSIYDGLYGATGSRLPRDEFAIQFDTLVAHHELGFDVLTAPRDPVLGDHISARDVTTVLDAVLPRYDVVIADTPPSLNDVVIATLDRSDSVLTLASLDVPSLRNLTAFLDVLRRLHIDDSVIELLLNKADSDVGVTIAQAQESFQNRFTAAIPYDRTVSRAINLGTTVVEYAPRSKAAKALAVHCETVARRLVGDRPATAAAAAPKRRFSLSLLLARVRPGGTS